MKLIAVYGTLKAGYHNHSLLKKAEFVGDFVTQPQYTMYSFGGFPAVGTHGNTPITTEIYRVTNEQLGKVYSLEGYTGNRGDADNWYDTVEIDTPFGNAEMFVMHDQLPNKVITSGIW
jgi:gamma-glutamylcyclotransferase (GGCT)/AIG2-like uncharacterized protein YtfP